MASDRRYPMVLDVNTLVSAYLFPDSALGQVLKLVLEKHRLLLSLAVASQLREVFARPKFDPYLSKRRRDELVAATIQSSEFIEPSIRIVACRDSTDNSILELAVDSSAAAIVTGDQDMLALHPFQGIPILAPRQFLMKFQGDEPPQKV
jgi:putative PIN family toxin of toxin-antitoxin system